MKKKLIEQFHFLKKIYINSIEGEIAMSARSLAFSTLLSLIPVIALTLILIQQLGGFEIIYPKIELLLSQYLHETAGKDAAKAIKKIMVRLSKTTISVSYIIILMISSLKVLQDLEYAIHKAWLIKNTRTFMQKFLFNSFLLLTIPLFLAFYATISSLNIIQTYQKNFRIDFLELFIFFVSILIINKAIPSKFVHWKPALLSSFLTSSLLLFMQSIFHLLVIKVFNYSKLYGGLASLPLFMIWIYIFWWVVLYGVTFCASYQNNSFYEEKTSET